MIRRLERHELPLLTWADQLKTTQFHWGFDQLVALFDTHEFWAFFEQGEVVAAVAVIQLPQAWEIPWLATHPRFQRRGRMFQLLEKALEAKRQVSEIWLEVHEDNGPARALYRKLGFEEVGRRPNYYSDGGTALLLTRKP
jgi:ribosomal protein S18 acetylase RimI-like enzyme